MNFYLKRFPDGGVEYSPVGRDREPREGFEIVDVIPQDIRDREPGGKDFAVQVDPRDAKLVDLEARVVRLEGKA
jgi:elongation factor P hydroxylase